MNELLVIDGAYGEGGGQILRSSLALSLVTGRPVRIEHIRASRPKPGLRPQHLTAVQAAAQIAQAEVTGDQIGSQSLTFKPQTVVPGHYHFQIGTAGSTTLVLQTVLPALMLANEPSSLTLEGGTHNPLAPPFDFIAEAYLPLVNRMGPTIRAKLKRPGFYPAGGGRIDVEVRPSASLTGLELLERGRLLRSRARILLANLPEHIAKRERNALLRKTGWDKRSVEIEIIRQAPGPGNVLIVLLEWEALTEVFSECGQIGLRAEQVARRVLKQIDRYLKADVPVGEFLADQLLLPLGIAASQGRSSLFRTVRPSSHFQTHAWLLQQFLDIRIHTETFGPDEQLVRIEPAQTTSSLDETSA